MRHFSLYLQSPFVKKKEKFFSKIQAPPFIGGDSKPRTKVKRQNPPHKCGG
jgi:hypothetical protein